MRMDTAPTEFNFMDVQFKSYHRLVGAVFWARTMCSRLCGSAESPYDHVLPNGASAPVWPTLVAWAFCSTAWSLTHMVLALR